MGCICIKAEAFSSCIKVSAKRIDGIHARCSLVCDVNRDAYLKVTPAETQWIDVDEVVTYKVRSNQNWKIV